MIEVKIPGLRDGRGYLKIGPSATAVKGSFVKLDSAAWGAEAPGTPGKAYNGAIGYVPATSGDKINTFVYPTNKLLYKPEDSEVNSDTILSGEGVIIYKGGQYETDAYNTTDTWAGLAPGSMLYLDASSVLTTSFDDTSFVPRARYLGMASSYSSKQSARALVWYELLEQVYMVSGMLGF